VCASASNPRRTTQQPLPLAKCMLLQPVLHTPAANINLDAFFHMISQIKFPSQPYNLLRTKFPAPPALGGAAGLSDAGFDLLNRLLTLDPSRRITAKEALDHPW